MHVNQLDRSARLTIMGLLFVFLGAGCGTESGAKAWRVTPDGTGDAPTIQAAIELASDGDSILVQPGTYRGDGNRDIELRGKAIVLIGTGGAETTIIDCQGREGEPHRGFHCHEKEKAGTVIEGFTITNGYVEGKLPACYGGAIFCTYSSPTFRDVWMVGNRSDHFGGAMVCYKYASPVLERIRFIDNTAVNNGGGFGVKMNSHPKLNDVVFAGNRAIRGGGFWCWNAEATITNATFYGNSASMQGSSLWTNTAKVNLQNSIIAFSEESVMLVSTHLPMAVKVTNCNFFGNEGGDDLPFNAIDGGGNFSLDPLFVAPEKGDLTVQVDSPCAPGNHPDGIDAGGIGAMAAARTRE